MVRQASYRRTNACCCSQMFRSGPALELGKPFGGPASQRLRPGRFPKSWARRKSAPKSRKSSLSFPIFSFLLDIVCAVVMLAARFPLYPSLVSYSILTDSLLGPATGCAVRVTFPRAFPAAERGGECPRELGGTSVYRGGCWDEPSAFDGDCRVCCRGRPGHGARDHRNGASGTLPRLPCLSWRCLPRRCRLPW